MVCKDARRIMKGNKLVKIIALATLVSAAEASMNQGAVDLSSESDKLLSAITSSAPLINTPKPIRDSINSILDTMRIDTNSVITKDLLRSYMFVHSQDTVNPLYASIDAVLDTINSRSKVITKDFMSSYIRMRVEEKSLYDRDQLKSKKLIDTIPLNLKYVSRLDYEKLAYIESIYHSDAHNTFSGASGLFQLMEPTYKTYGQGDFEINKFKTDKNAFAALNYLTFLETDIPANYNRQNFGKQKKNWDALSHTEKVDFIIMAYNAGHCTLYMKNFNLKKMPKETKDYLPKFRDAELVISLDHLTNFHALTFSDTSTLNNPSDIKSDTIGQFNVYSAAVIVDKRVQSIAKLLESAEKYLSKNFSSWNTIDIQTQQELVVVASTIGPRALVDKYKENIKNKNWNFRYDISHDIISRINDFSDKLFLTNIHNAWDYSEKDAVNKEDIKKNNTKGNVKIYHPQQKIAEGMKLLMNLESNLEKQLTQNYLVYDSTSGRRLKWDEMSADKKREILSSAATYGYNKFRQQNFDPLKLSDSDQKKICVINYALEKYSIITEFKTKLLSYDRNQY